MKDVSARSVAIDVAGLRRSYVLALPERYDSSTPYALVLGFHGSGANGEAMRAHLDIEALSAGAAIFAYPDGLEVSDGGSGWHLTKDGRDVAFVDALVANLEGAYCVNQNAVFAAGFSYGGWMVNALACARPGLLRGIASIAGGGPTTDCAGGVAAMIVHGAGDFNEPIHSGEESRDRWLQVNGCPKTRSPVSRLCFEYPGCPSDQRISWCRHDGGHEIPDFARRAIWDFFASLH